MEEDNEELTGLFWKAGVTRVTQGKNMSTIYTGAAHDGEYTLRRYTRIVSQSLWKKMIIRKRSFIGLKGAYNRLKADKHVIADYTRHKRQGKRRSLMSKSQPVLI
jgi:hypothetical protein